MEKTRPGPLDKAFITELVYGTLRTLNTLDWIIQQHIRQPLSKQTPWIRNILRLGVYQIMHMDRVPAPAAVNEAVNQARRFGHAGSVKFVNGVLRNILRSAEEINFPDLEANPAGHISVRYSHSRWLVEKWIELLGVRETIDLCLADNQPPPLTVRANTLKTGRNDLLALLREMGLQADKSRYAPEGIDLRHTGGLQGLAPFEEGLFQVQDEGSMLAGHAVGAVPGALVIDAAAAPGGKSTHLAQIMRDRGTVIACDIHPHKLKLIKDNCRRLGITCISTVEADARSIGERYRNKADYVLLDAPCSGTGVLRRRPDLRWRKVPGRLPGLVALQRELLDSAAQCVKPGGVLVYSTCSVLPEENINQVRDFLKRSIHFTAGDLSVCLPAALGGEETLRRGYIQLYPHRHGTDGFFIARLIRKRDC